MSSFTACAAARAVQPLPFAAIPHALILDPKLEPLDVRLVGVLLGYCRGKPAGWPSVATLAEAVDRSPRTVQLALRRLADAGWGRAEPAPNPTGRQLVCTWLAELAPPQPAAAHHAAGAESCAPGAQPYTQGLPRARAPWPAPDPRSPQKETSAPPKLPETRTRAAAPGPVPAAELPTLFGPWLQLAERHPLRQLALERLAAAGQAWPILLPEAHPRPAGTGPASPRNPSHAHDPDHRPPGPPLPGGPGRGPAARPGHR